MLLILIQISKYYFVLFQTTENIEIFAQYIFSSISRRPLGARTFDVRKNYYYNRTNRTNW